MVSKQILKEVKAWSLWSSGESILGRDSSQYEGHKVGAGLAHWKTSKEARQVKQSEGRWSDIGLLTHSEDFGFYSDRRSLEDFQ